MKYLKALLPSHNQLLIELSFLIGIVFLGASFIGQNTSSFFVGLGMLFYSLYVFEMSLFGEEKAQQKKVSVVLFFLIALGILLFLIFLSYPRIIEPLAGVPLSKNWLIYVLIAFFIIDLAFLAAHIRKSKSANAPNSAPKAHTLRTLPKAAPKKEAMETSKQLPKPPRKHKTPRQLFYIFLFYVGILISIFSLVSAEWITFVIILIVMAASLYSYRLTLPVRLAEKAPSKAVPKAPLWQRLLNRLGLRIKKKTFAPVEIETHQPRDIIVKGVASYETDFDRLYALVQAKKIVKAQEIAQKFGINIKKAEEWAKILESSNLIEILYTPFGEFTVRIKGNDKTH